MKKNHIVVLLLLAALCTGVQAQVVQGMRVPALSTKDRNEIMVSGNPYAKGQLIFNTDNNCQEFWNGTEWISLCSGGSLGLVSFTGCDAIKVAGVYDLDKTPAEQDVRIDIPVNVRKLGEYRYTATCNGINFIAMGTFVNLGPMTVSLYVDPSSPLPTSTTGGAKSATVIIDPIEGIPNPISQICNGIQIPFFRRSDATMKIVNIGGTQNGTGLCEDGDNHDEDNACAVVGAWLQDVSTTIDGTHLDDATDYSGTQAIEVVNINVRSSGATPMAELQRALQTASIVWVGASETYSYGVGQLLAEWSAAGKGIVLITGDKTEESTVADAMGYYIEDGTSGIGTFDGSVLPQVFSSSNGAPFDMDNGTYSIGSSGSACGYVSSNNGVTLMTIGAQKFPSAFADIDRGVFIFGDKFGDVASGDNWDNFAKVLTDIFAWSLKTAPINVDVENM